MHLDSIRDHWSLAFIDDLRNAIDGILGFYYDGAKILDTVITKWLDIEFDFHYKDNGYILRIVIDQIPRHHAYSISKKYKMIGFGRYAMLTDNSDWPYLCGSLINYGNINKYKFISARYSKRCILFTYEQNMMYNAYYLPKLISCNYTTRCVAEQCYIGEHFAMRF